MNTLGSLFDGAGTCQFAALKCGIKPVWSSEIEPYPLAVTKKNFPETEQLGDITKIDGAKITPVDVITFGSPCQDLSVAGKQKGLSGERSSLFLEAIRIIKEMRNATQNRYPQIIMWENVPGAFNSNNGEDFRRVLTEIVNIAEDVGDIPKPSKWGGSGEIVGNGYSIAWRVLDAQYWGVPQRRRRIYLVGDFTGQRASKILFERKGLSRHFAESRKAWKEYGRYFKDCFGTTNQKAVGIDTFNQSITGDQAKTFLGSHTDTDALPVVAVPIENHPNDSRVKLETDGNVQTLTSRMGTGGGNTPLIMEKCPVFALDRASFNQGENAKFSIGITENGIAQTVVAKDPGAVAYNLDSMSSNSMKSANPNSGIHKTTICKCLDTMTGNPTCYQGGTVLCVRERCGCEGGGKGCLIQEGKTGTLSTNNDQFLVYEDGYWWVRRLTTTECARLQGMPDEWGKDVPKHSDSAEYKMWGNGMALPTLLYVIEGIAIELRKQFINNVFGGKSYGQENMAIPKTIRS